MRVCLNCVLYYRKITSGTSPTLLAGLGLPALALAGIGSLLLYAQLIMHFFYP